MFWAVLFWIFHFREILAQEDRGGNPNIVGISTNGISPEGGAVITIDGNNLLPADFDHSSVASEAYVRIYFKDESAGVPDIACPIIPHFSSSSQVICQVSGTVDGTVGENAVGWGSESTYLVEVIVDGVSTTQTKNLHVSGSTIPRIVSFAPSGIIAPGAASGFWTTWFNTDTPDPSSATEEKEQPFNIGCASPLGIEVREAGSDDIMTSSDLVNTVGTCACYADIFNGLICTGSDGDKCTVNHEVRFYCGDANVIDFMVQRASDKVVKVNEDVDEIDVARTFYHPPGLYDADGNKYAECNTHFVNPDSGNERMINGYLRTVNSDLTQQYRCQLDWTKQPTVGSYAFKYTTANEGDSIQFVDYFLDSGNRYSLQIRPIIDSVSPSSGSINGGTVLTVTGQYLQGDVSIKVGGENCENVEVNADQTVATCTTPIESSSCAAGDEPDKNQNCVDYTSNTHIDGMITSDVGKSSWHSSSGFPCTTQCASESQDKRPRCSTSADGTGLYYCNIPACDNYARFYPGAPGVKVTGYTEIVEVSGDNQLNRHITVGASLDGNSPTERYEAEYNSALFSLLLNQLEFGPSIEDASHAVSQVFFKPPLDGYYSLIIYACDKKCTLSLALDEPNKGCPGDLAVASSITYFRTGPSDEMQWSSRVWGEKIHLESDNQYFLRLVVQEDSTGDFGQFGFLYHGTDSSKNMEHGDTGVTKETFNGRGSLYYTEKQELVVKAESTKEVQSIDTVAYGTDSFNVYVCPSDGTDSAECDSVSVSASMSTADIVEALEGTRSSQCQTSGGIEDAFYNDVSSTYYGHKITAEITPFCGKSSYKTNTGTPMTLFHETVDGQIELSKITEVCLATKGYANEVNLKIFGQKKNGGSFTREVSAPWTNTQPNSWSFSCFDLDAWAQQYHASLPDDFDETVDYGTWTLLFINLVDTSNSGPLYVDEIHLGKVQSFFTVVQTSTGTMPGAPVTEYKADFDGTILEITIKTTSGGCGGAFSKLRHSAGTPGATVTLASSISTLGAGVTGDFDVIYDDKRATIQTSWLEDGENAKVYNELYQQFGDDFGTVEVTTEGSCTDGFTIELEWHQAGDIADLEFDVTNLAGESSSVSVIPYRHGGVLFKTINGAYLSQAETTPQVQLWATGVQAACNSDCSFSYLTGAVISTVLPAAANADAQVTISGSGFKATGNTVLVGGTLASVISESTTSITFVADNHAAGTHDVVIQTHEGSSNSGSVTLTAVITDITPSSGPIGTTVTITGSGFDEVSGFSCSVVTSTTTEVTCIVLESSEQAHTITIGGATTTFTVTSSPTVTCNPSSTTSPSGKQDLTVTCDVGVTSITSIFVDGEPETGIISNVDNVVTFTPSPRPNGIYSLQVETNNGVGSTTVEYSATATVITNPAGGLFGGGAMRIEGNNFGTDPSAVSISVGSASCPVTAIESGFVECTVPAHSTSTVTLHATGSSVRSGLFSPSSVEVATGTKVSFEWSFFLEDQSTPAVQMQSSGEFELTTQDGNTGSAYYIFATPGVYTVSTGVFDGFDKEITGTVTVTAAADVSEAITFTVGPQVVDLSSSAGSNDCGENPAQAQGSSYAAGQYTYSYGRTNIFTDVTVVGATVTVTSEAFNSDCDVNILAENDFCAPGGNSCDVNVSGGSHVVSITDGIAISSDLTSPLSFAPTVTSVSPQLGSMFGGTKVTLTGVNLLSDATTLPLATRGLMDCDPDILSNSGTEIIFFSAYCGMSTLSNVEFMLGSSPLATTFGTSMAQSVQFNIDSASANGVFDISYSNVALSDGTYEAVGFAGTMGEMTVASCQAVDISSGAGSTTCDLGTEMSGTNVAAVFGISDIGNGMATNIAISPSLSAMQPVEGSFYGGVQVTLTGIGMPLAADVSVMSSGQELCNPCDVDNSLAADGTVVFTMPDSGVTSGLTVVDVAVTKGGALVSNTLSFSYRALVTPTVNSIVFTEGTGELRVNMAKGVNADCARNTISVGGVDCPVITCESVRRSGPFISCTLPNLVAGQQTVLVSNIDTGNSDGNSNYDVPFSVDSIDPVTSGVAGGAPMTVTGNGMDVDAAAITICGQTCVVDTVASSPVAIVCAIPAGSDGTCDVVVNAGNSETLSGGFEYDSSLVAVITGITAHDNEGNPKKVQGGTAGGTVITITGAGFNTNMDGNVITIGGTECVPESVSTTEIVCRTGVIGETGFFDIFVNVKNVGLFTNENVDNSQFRYVNAWSSAATWGCSTGTFAECTTAPNAQGDLVEIPTGVDVLLDVSTVVLSVLLIRGSLVWDTSVSDIELSAEYILVIDGAFVLGTEDDPMTKTAAITLYGHHRSIRLPVYGAKVFAARSGTVDIHGARVDPTWTDLASTADAGASSITIRTPNGLVGWDQPNARIAIAPTGTENSIVEAETRVITGITDNGDGTHTLALDEPLDFLHLGVSSTWDGFDGPVTFDQRAEIGLLTRNVKLTGSFNDAPWYSEIPECEDDFNLDLGLHSVQNCFVNRWNDEEGSDKYGVHMLLHSVTHGKIEFMEVHNAGQASELGRYPVHFHNSYDQPDSYFRGLGIWQTYNRAMTMHAVNNALFEWNVAYNNMGHAFFTEDGVETGNTIQYNLAIKTKTHRSLLSVDQTPAGFWIVNMNNRFIGNHAAGCAGSGFWINPPDHSTGSNVNDEYCPREIPALEFRDNSAHSCGLFGMWIFEKWTPIKGNFDGVCNEDTSNQAGADHPLVGFKSWHNERGYEVADGSGIYATGFISANNMISEFAFKLNEASDNYGPDSTTLHNSIAIGTTDAHSELTKCRSFGIQTPWKLGSMIYDGIKFYNYNEGNKANHRCAAIDPCYGSYMFDCGRVSLWSNVEFSNTDRKANFHWEYETVFWDLDGSLTGTGNANSKITPKSNLYNRHCSDISDGWDVGFPAQVCDDNAHFHRISFEQIEPESLNGITMNINNENTNTPDTVTAQVPWREQRGEHERAWMYMALQDYPQEIWLEGFYNHPNVSFTFQSHYDNPGHFSVFKIAASNIPDRVKFGPELDAIPTGVAPEDDNGWFIDTNGDVYITQQSDGTTAWSKAYRKHFSMEKCFYENCEVPILEDPVPPAEQTVCFWSEPSCWEENAVPADGANVTIPIDRHVKIDVETIILPVSLQKSVFPKF